MGDAQEELEALLQEPRMQELQGWLIEHLNNGKREITPEEAGNIISQGHRYNHNQNHLDQILKATVKSVKAFIKKYKGISTGEIQAAASAAYHCAGWQVDQNVLTKNFKQLMQTKSIEKSKIHKHVAEGTRLHHPHVIRKNNNYYHVADDPLTYLKDHLINEGEAMRKKTNGYERTPQTERPEKRLEETVEEGYVSPVQEILAEQERKREEAQQYTLWEEKQKSPLERYIDEYGLSDSDFPHATMPVNGDLITEHLKDAGLRGEDHLKQWRRMLKRTIIRRYDLQKVLYEQGTQEINPYKLNHFAKRFMDSKQFRKDTDNLFPLVQD